MKNKAQIINDIDDFCNKTSQLLDDISEGERTYSEIGEYFHDCLGEDIITVLENIKEYIESVEKGDNKWKLI